MFCAISGNAPEHPVISTKSGHLFEQSVVEKYIESTGKCPVTGEPLEAADLLPVKVASTVKPRPLAATSIPGMLSLFQTEWDALMLETHSLKQQLETVRQELGHALYNHDAACRVIARLIKERDDARQALAEAQPSAAVAAAAVAAASAPPTSKGGEPAAKRAKAAAPAVESSAGELTPEIIASFEATSKTLSKGRKKRQPPADQTSAEALAAFGEVASEAVLPAGPVCVDVHASEPLAAAGGADGSVILFDCAKGAVGAKLAGHSKRVNAIRLHPSKPLALTCSQDKSARIWNTDGTQLHVLSHSGDVTGVTLHATGDYCVTSCSDKSWSLFDIDRGSCVLRVPDGSGGYTCAGFHPDGLILGTGVDSVVRIWDVKSQQNVASFEGHTGTVTCLAFSENGYYLATGSADTTVKMWDLRKLKNFHTIEPGAAVGGLAFDNSGLFLAVGSADARCTPWSFEPPDSLT